MRYAVVERRKGKKSKICNSEKKEGICREKITKYIEKERRNVI